MLTSKDVPLATPEEMKDYLASPGNTRPRGATPSEMTALRSSHQGDAVTAAERHGISPERLRSILTLPCAPIRFHRPPTRRPAYKAPGYAPFTIEALGCWIFPRQGRVYMAIDNIVYNIKGTPPGPTPSVCIPYSQMTDLASTHPGGSNLITALSGRHATLEFKRDHPHNWEVLLDGMEKVGHVVPTFSAERFAALRPDEVCFRDDCWVYRVTKQTFVRGMMEWTLDHRNTRTWGLNRWEEERRGFEGEFARSEPWLGRGDVDPEELVGVVGSLRMLGGLVVGKRPVENGVRDRRRRMTRGELAGRYARLDELRGLEEMMGWGWGREDPEERWEREGREGSGAVCVWGGCL